MTQHPNDNARDAKPMVWIFEGNNVLWIVGGFAAALVTFRRSFDAGFSLVESGVLAALPISLVILYVLVLRAGKPKSYDADVFTSLNFRIVCWLERRGWMRSRSCLYRRPAVPPIDPRRSA